MKTNTTAKPQEHVHSGFWLEKAWPEGAEAFGKPREKAFGAGTNFAWAKEVFDEHVGSN